MPWLYTSFTKHLAFLKLWLKLTINSQFFVREVIQKKWVRSYTPPPFHKAIIRFEKYKTSKKTKRICKYHGVPLHYGINQNMSYTTLLLLWTILTNNFAHVNLTTNWKNLYLNKLIMVKYTCFFVGMSAKSVFFFFWFLSLVKCLIFKDTYIDMISLITLALCCAMTCYSALQIIWTLLYLCVWWIVIFNVFLNFFREI